MHMAFLTLELTSASLLLILLHHVVTIVKARGKIQLGCPGVMTSSSRGAVPLIIGHFGGKEILLYFSLGSPTACCCCCEFAATTLYETMTFYETSIVQ
jgi:hypothetical protein